MKSIVKAGLSFAFAAALILSFMTVTSDSATAVAPCPPSHCPDVLDGYTYQGTCAGTTGSGPCLGWVYSRGGERCHVSALGGI